MVVVKIELWPKGLEQNVQLLGMLMVTNDGTGTTKEGNYNVIASHAGKYITKKGIFKEGKVFGFLRKLSPYRLVFRALKSLGET